jgi:hypothetical protein
MLHIGTNVLLLELQIYRFKDNDITDKSIPQNNK